MDDDPFDELFGLEDKYYEEGYNEGLKDGLLQARLEARIFGIEKGYEKFIEMGKLQARARFWAADIKQQSTVDSNQQKPDYDGAIQDSGTRTRLAKHVDVLLALVDPSTLSTENSDDAVSDFDDRLKRAQAKCIVIERILGEPRGSTSVPAGNSDARATSNKNINDF